MINHVRTFSSFNVLQTWKTNQKSLREEHKRVSKVLDIPWSTVQRVNIRLRNWGATMTLPDTGQHPKLVERREENWSGSLASTDCVACEMMVSCVLYVSRLRSRMTNWNPIQFCKNTFDISLTHDMKMCCSSTKPVFNFLGAMFLKRCLEQTRHLSKNK